MGRPGEDKVTTCREASHQDFSKGRSTLNLHCLVIFHQCTDHFPPQVLHISCVWYWKLSEEWEEGVLSWWAQVEFLSKSHAF